MTGASRCRRLLGRRVSEYGRLCHGDGATDGATAPPGSSGPTFRRLWRCISLALLLALLLPSRQPAWAADRFVDLGLTIHDTQTHLEWEKKVPGSDDPHGVHQTLTWCEASGDTATVCMGNAASWIARVNAERFSGHQDWRLPAYEELLSILATASPGTGRGCQLSPCIDPVFGSTGPASYWSGTEGWPDEASVASFYVGTAGPLDKRLSLLVRGVRRRR